jgi:hypothetical protein
MAKKTLPPIHLACSDDELRPVLQHIQILDGIATATNASIIAQLNLAEYSSLENETIRQLSGKLIHRDTWESIQDAEFLTVEENIIHYQKGGINADFNIECNLKFPDVKNLINSVANSLFDKKSFVCFNPKWIQIASKIFPSENLICRFYSDNEMMVFFPSGEAKGFMGIMPLKLTEEEAVIDFSLS